MASLLRVLALLRLVLTFHNWLMLFSRAKQDSPVSSWSNTCLINAVFHFRKGSILHVAVTSDSLVQSQTSTNLRIPSTDASEYLPKHRKYQKDRVDLWKMLPKIHNMQWCSKNILKTDWTDYAVRAPDQGLHDFVNVISKFSFVKET